MLGKQILNYEVKSLIGEGGMGDVYLGEHLSIGREVAIKVLKPELASNQEIRSRFKNEASVMARLQHPGIVALYDYVEQDDGLYLIMEYVQGKELTDLLKQLDQPLSIDRAKKIMAQVLAAFAYAHENGVVHRDVKPSNIIIDKKDNVKVLDFGIAKLVGESQFNLTKTGTQVGTVYYMSPEQVKAQDLDQRSDIYSLGITFYEVLSGFCPYTSLTSEYEVYDKIVREPLISLTETMGDSYDTLWAVIEKATAKKPEDRFQDCTSMLRDIENGKTIPISPKRNSKPRSSKANLILPLAIIGFFIMVGIIVATILNGANDENSFQATNSIEEDEIGQEIESLPDNDNLWQFKQIAVSDHYSLANIPSFDYYNGPADYNTNLNGFRPIGWSLNGENFAFIKNSSYSMSSNTDLIIYDIIQDKVKETVRISGQDVDGEHFRSYSLDHPYLERILKKNKISKNFSFQKGSEIAGINNNMKYNFYADIDIDGEKYFNEYKINLFAKSNYSDKAKSINKIKGTNLINCEIVGLIKSPIENRVILMVCTVENGFEGERDVDFHLFGCRIQKQDFSGK